MRKNSICTLSNLLAGAALLAGFSTAAYASPPPGYSLVWQDEFTSLNPAAWHIETFKGPGPQTQTYVNDGQHVQIVNDPSADDGHALQITATSDMESGRINTYNRVNAQYGFIEARIKLPYGKGMWPAFWLLGSDYFAVDDPACGEIDVMENIGKQQWWGVNEASLHCPNHSVASSLHADYHLPKGQHFQDGYHLFQVLWQPDNISFYVDGSLYETRYRTDVAPGEWVFDHPFFFIINLAVGGDWPGAPDGTTVWPQRMLVDYVRLYKGTPAIMPAPAGLTAVPGDDGCVNLSWPGNPGAVSYSIYRKSADGWTQLDTVAATRYTDRGLSDGVRYAYQIEAVNEAGASAPSNTATATPTLPNETPFGGSPWQVPGTIAAADYDAGGESVAYHTGTHINRGGAYRMDESVGVEESDDPQGLYDVSYVTEGEWLKYTVDVQTAGVYTIGLRVATTETGQFWHIEDDSGQSLTGEIDIPATGGWQKWTTVYAHATLHAGKQALKLAFDKSEFNVNNMTFVLTETPTQH